MTLPTTRAVGGRAEPQHTSDPGLASSFDRPLDRLMSRDGSFEVTRVGQRGGLSEGFVALATMPTLRLVATFVAGYLTMNLTFGAVYMAIGVDEIGNADLSSAAGRWLSAIGMSVQTLTTVGYGSLYPTTPATWLLAAVEGVFGILGFSLIAAVIFARFARPTARLAYSSHALIAPYKDGWSVQLRTANRRNMLLVELEARLLLAMADVGGSIERLNYFVLPLQIDRISFLPLSWTLVHPITPESPLAGMSHADLTARRAELMLIIKGIDEGYMQPVIARRSFRFDEIVWGGRFVSAYGVADGEARLYLSKLSEFTPESAPDRLPS
jgi:inward rectifier potassium channel